MTQVVGIAMLYTFFLAFIAIMAADIGWRIALVAIGAVAGSVLWLSIAAILISQGSQ